MENKKPDLVVFDNENNIWLQHGELGINKFNPRTFEVSRPVLQKLNFEPMVGKSYHLYKNHREESFLSIIAPNECSFKHLGSFRLNSDKMWVRL